MYNRGSYLIHYGIPGQRKGHRRFQNEDGSYTPEGRRRYGIGEASGLVSRQPEEKQPIGTKSGPYENFKYKDPNQRIREGAKKVKELIDKNREKRRSDLEQYIKEAGLTDRISDKDFKDLQRYKTGQRKTIVKYMQTHPNATFQEADRYETRRSLALGLAGVVGLAALTAAIPKIQAAKAAKYIASQSSVGTNSINSALGRKSIQIKGSEWIKMMYGRQNWGAWA